MEEVWATLIPKLESVQLDSNSNAIAVPSDGQATQDNLSASVVSGSQPPINSEGQMQPAQMAPPSGPPMMGQAPPQYINTQPQGNAMPQQAPPVAPAAVGQSMISVQYRE